MTQKLIISKSVKDINEYLENGWRVVSITAQHISTGSSQFMIGEFAILLEKAGSFLASDKPVTYTEEEVTKLLEIQRGNSYVAIYNHTGDQTLAGIASKAPEPGQWRKNNNVNNK